MPAKRKQKTHGVLRGDKNLCRRPGLLSHHRIGDTPGVGGVGRSVNPQEPEKKEYQRFIREYSQVMTR